MNKYNIGDYVITKKHGNKGRISDIHARCPQPPYWIEGQTVPVTEQELQGLWYSVLCHPSGSVCVSESDIEKIDPFPFENPWNEETFGK